MTAITEDTNLTIHQIVHAMGDDADEFIEVMEVVEDIINNPTKYYGATAMKYAVQLAAFRTKISAKAQYYKWQKGGDATIRARKDTLLAMYHALEENINTLKLSARVDLREAGI